MPGLGLAYPEAENAIVHAATAMASLVATTCWNLSAIRTAPNMRNCRNEIGDDLDPEAFSLDDVNPKTASLQSRRAREVRLTESYCSVALNINSRCTFVQLAVSRSKAMGRRFKPQCPHP